MNETARLWLPPEALDCDPVRLAIEATVTLWSSRWFARDRAVAGARIPTHTATLRLDADGWCFPGQGIGLSASRRAIDRLLAWVLDARLSDETTTPRDREILERLETSLLADLAETLEKALGLTHEPREKWLLIASPFDELGGLIVQVEDDHGAVLLSVAIPLDAAAPLAKTADRQAGATTPLMPLRQALAETPLLLDAVLGYAELTLADLQGLVPGDTLILDRPLDGAAELTLNGSGAGFAHAKLTDADGQIGLLLQA